MNAVKSLAVISLTALVAAFFAATWAAGQPDRYSATTTVALAPAPSLADDADVIDVVGGLDRGAIVETLAGLATSSTVVSAAAQEAAIPAPDLNDYEVDAVRVTSANLVDVSVSGPTPDFVAALANTTATTAAAQFNALYRVYRVDVVTPAGAPTESDRPSVAVVTLAGAIVGGLAAAIVVAAIGSRRRERHLASVRAPGERLAS